MSTLKVNTIESETPNVTIADGLNVTGVSTVATLNATNIVNSTQLSNRNLIINGAMNVAQRGTSSTSTGYNSVDRFAVNFTGTDEAPTQAQVDVSSGTTPYTNGFRKALKVTNGNQTSGAGADDYVYIAQKFESQDISNSGWNYLSSSSFITLSFWVKSSVAQNFYGYVRTHDGTKYNYPFETGSLTADTWTKITKTIAGNSNIQIDNDANTGFEVVIAPFLGTNDTASVTLNQWVAWNSGVNRTPDNTTTWYTTNDATFEITGVQLEVGSAATPFEHRSYGDELLRCQRYYHVLIDGDNSTDSFGNATCYNSTSMHFVYQLSPQMRTTPTLDYTTGSNYYNAFQNNTNDTFDQWSMVGNSHPRAVDLMASSGVSVMSGASALLRINNASAKIRFTAEL